MSYHITKFSTEVPIISLKISISHIHASCALTFKFKLLKNQ